MRRVTDEIYLLEQASLGFGNLGVNAFLVLAEVPVVVDAGIPWRGPAMLAELRRAGVRVGRIVLTHGDPDHMGSVEYLRRHTGAEVCAAAAERPNLNHQLLVAMRGRRRFWCQLAAVGRGAPTVDRWLEDGEMVDGLRVISTPGHTPGHICLGLGDTVIGGDAFLTRPGQVREGALHMHMDLWGSRRAIEKLAAQGHDLAVAGHGPAVRGASAKLGELAAGWQKTAGPRARVSS